MPDIDRIQRVAHELRQKAVELEEELSTLMDQIDAKGAYPPADSFTAISDGQGRITQLAPVSDAPCEPKAEGDDAA